MFIILSFFVIQSTPSRLTKGKQVSVPSKSKSSAAARIAALERELEQYKEALNAVQEKKAESDTDEPEESPEELKKLEELRKKRRRERIAYEKASKKRRREEKKKKKPKKKVDTDSDYSDDDNKKRKDNAGPTRVSPRKVANQGKDMLLESSSEESNDDLNEVGDVQQDSASGESNSGLNGVGETIIPWWDRPEDKYCQPCPQDEEKKEHPVTPQRNNVNKQSGVLNGNVHGIKQRDVSTGNIGTTNQSPNKQKTGVSTANVLDDKVSQLSKDQKEISNDNGGKPNESPNKHKAGASTGIHVAGKTTESTNKQADVSFANVSENQTQSSKNQMDVSTSNVGKPTQVQRKKEADLVTENVAGKQTHSHNKPEEAPDGNGVEKNVVTPTSIRTKETKICITCELSMLSIQREETFSSVFKEDAKLYGAFCYLCDRLFVHKKPAKDEALTKFKPSQKEPVYYCYHSDCGMKLCTDCYRKQKISFNSPKK